MFIKEIIIRNFGCITNKHIEFESGLNIVYGKNESGKSTIFEFIHGMLYGLDIQRGKVSKDDLYRKYEPWDNSSFFSGMLRFETGDKTFRLERNFYKKDKRVTLVCENDGEELSVPDGDLNILLEGVDEETFKNNFMVPQEKYTVDCDLLYNVAGNEISGLSPDINESVNYLNSEKKVYEKKLKGLRIEREKEIYKYEVEKEYITNDISLQQQSIERHEADLHGLAEDNYDQKIKKYYFILGTLFIIALGMTLLIRFYALIIYALLIPALIYIYNKLKYLKGINKHSDKARNDIMLKLRSSKEIIRERSQILNNITEEINEETDYQEKIHKLYIEINAIQKAINDINEADKRFVYNQKKQIENYASCIFDDITLKRHNTLIVDNNKELKILAQDNYRGVEGFSTGTKQQANLALRLAAFDKIYNNIQFPFLLDDVFVMYDDKRIQKSIDQLLKVNRQIIIFTCQNREMLYLEKCSVKYNKIIL